MKILIYTEPFLPPAYLPRIRYFCNYFIKKGWDIHLVTEKSELMDNLPKNVSIFYVDYYKCKNRVLSKIEWIIKFVFNFLWDYKGKYFYKKTARFWKNNQYDLVFASTCFTFPLTTAMRTAKKKDIPCFVDLRDIMEQAPDDNYYMAYRTPKIFGNLITNKYKKINYRRRNKVLQQANGVTTVSPWHVKTLSKWNENTHLIYNGFDESVFIPRTEKTDKFTVSYFGRLYNAKIRSPELLFQAFQTLVGKAIFNPDNAVMKWYVDEKSKKIIEKTAIDYNLTDYVEYYQFIPPKEVSETANKSSILLVLNNNQTEKRYFGIMTTKFFEAIGNNKPILCIPDSQKLLSELIVKTNCGLVSSDANEVEDFLKLQFSYWKKQGYTSGNLDEQSRLSFSRKNGAEILENIFINELKKK